MNIIGDYHMHTRASDGSGSVQDMVTIALEKGLREIAITDHGLRKIKGLKPKRLAEYFSEIDSVQEQLTVLVGAELDLINGAGALDPAEGLREKCDIILMGIHILVWYSFRTFFSFLVPNLFYKLIKFTPKWRVRRNTAIVKKCLEQNDVDIWAHPGRYFKVDVVDVARTCVRKGILIELSGKRVSFRPIDFERMIELGAKFIIGSDAHHPNKIAEVDRVSEFLKNCDYTEDDIINLKRTYSEYKHEQEISGRNQERTAPQQRKSWFKRWF